MLKELLKYRFLTTSIVFLSSAATTLGDGPIISYDPTAGGVHLVRKFEVGSDVPSQINIRAKGPRAVADAFGNMNGVLFQATAQPESSLKSLPIKLSFNLAGEHDAVLHVKIADNNVTSDVPAWIWAIAAKFAYHEATGAVTMLNNPQTLAEKTFERRWRVKNGPGKRLVWARYHPAVDDTLIGFFLAAADAMIGDAEHIRTITDGLIGFENYSGIPSTIDRIKSSRAAASLDGIIGLEAKIGDCVMLNDLGDSFVFKIAGDKLQISGMPHYQFANEIKPEVYKANAKLTEIFRANRHVYLDTNPIIFKTVEDFAQLVALFNYIDATAPDQLNGFVKTLDSVFDRIPRIETPIALPLSTR